MSNRRAWFGTVVVVSALVLGACSKSSTPGATSNASVAASAPASVPAGGVNSGSSFCSELKTENLKASQLSSTIAAAVASHNFAATKAAFQTYFAAVAQDIAQVEATMTSAPADVQAALTTVNTFFAQLQSDVAGATSLKGLEASFEAHSNTAELKAAGATLSAYGKAQCGDLSSPTP